MFGVAVHSVRSSVLSFAVKVSAMKNETPHEELMRLLEAQLQVRRDEVFGGLSKREQEQYAIRNS